MKTLVGALALVFALATVISMIGLTVHGDHARIDHSRHVAGYQETALLY